MKPWATLTLFGIGMVLTFGASYGLAHALVPETVVQNWLDRAEHNDHAPSDAPEEVHDDDH